MEVSLDELLDCPLCIVMLSSPVNLPCLHTFCDSCIRNYIAANLGMGILVCPVCRLPFDAKTPLLHDFFKQSLLDITKKKSHLCQRHEREKMIRFCRSCVKSLCADCLVEENHSGHDVVRFDITERQTADTLAMYQCRIGQHNALVNKSWDYFVQQTNDEYDRVALEAKRSIDSQVTEMCNDVKVKAVALKKLIDETRFKLKTHVEDLTEHATIVAILAELDEQVRKALTLPIENKINFCQAVEQQVVEATSNLPEWSILVPKLKISFQPSVLSLIDVGKLSIETVEAKKKDMVFVRGMDGYHVTVLVDLDEPVCKVKDQVEFKTGIPASAQSLFYGRKVLQPHMPLSHYGISRDATLTLHMRASPLVLQHQQ